MTDYSSIVAQLPKPISKEEQYLYSLVLSAANIPHDDPSNSPFWRMEQYWRAFYIVMQDRYTYIVPSANTVGTVQLIDKSVTGDKLAENSVVEDNLSNDIKSKLLGDKSVTTSNLSDALEQRLLGAERITETMLASALAAKLLGNAEITEAMLADALVAKLLGDKKVTKAMLAQDVQDILDKVK